MGDTVFRLTAGSTEAEPQQCSSQCIQEALRTEPPPSPIPAPRIAIKLENVVKIFKTDNSEEEEPALNKVNLEVLEEELYVLMGPSGAGKSTVMLAIIGMAKLDSGNIYVCGNPVINGEPNRQIGFMLPVGQETAMYPEFTVRESFYYFGKLHGLAKSEVDETMGLIEKVLGFSDWHKQFKMLSSGNQRLVCFGSAILHKPKVLLMDEPTFGLDYPSARKIFNLIRILKKRGMSFLIITHATNEAEMADKMGLMIDGKLVIEGTVPELKLLFDKESLEDVFNEACTNEQFVVDFKMRALEASADNPNSSKARERLQKSLKLDAAEVAEDSTENLSSDNATGGWEDIKVNPKWNWTTCPMTASLYKNWVTLKHTKWTWLFIVLLPALQILSIIHTIGVFPRINVGVFNDELPNATTECPVLNTCTDYRDAGLFSCMFMHEMEAQRLQYTYYKNEAEAKRVLKPGNRNNNLTAYIGFNKTFSNSILKIMENAPFTDDDNAAFQLRMGYDSSNPILEELFFKAVCMGYFAFTDKVKAQCNYTTSAGTNIFKYAAIFEDVDFFGKYLSTCTFVAILWFFPIVSGATTMITERTNGIYTRSLIAGTSPLQMLLSNCIWSILYTNTQTLAWAVVVTFFEHIKIRGSLLLLMGIATGISIVGETIGMIYGMLLDNHLSAAIIVLGTYIPILMISGVIWPIESMQPAWVQPILWWLPASFSARSFRDICHRGLSFMTHRVYLGFASLFIWFAICTISFLFVAKRDRRIRFGL